MEINLPEETKRLIDDWIATGAYGSPEEVIREGVRRLGAAEAPTMESLREKIMVGVRDIESGRCGPIDIEEFKRRVREEAARRRRQ